MRSFAGLMGGRLRFVVVLYLALYVLLDWASLIDRSRPLAIPPWNPPVGLIFALLLQFGWCFPPAVYAVGVLSYLMFRDVPPAPLPLLFASVLDRLSFYISWPICLYLLLRLFFSILTEIRIPFLLCVGHFLFSLRHKLFCAYH